VDTHSHILWMEAVSRRSRWRLCIHIINIVSVVTRTKSGTCALCAGAYLMRKRLERVLGPGVTVRLSNGLEREFRGERRRTQGLRLSLILMITRLEQVKPVACFIHPDLAPRGAVRRVGPRPDPTRSARMDEPGRMAIRSGDGNRGSTAPSRAAYQPTGGRWEKNGGSNAPPANSPYVERPTSHD
jgi:hypothetical protein